MGIEEQQARLADTLYKVPSAIGTDAVDMAKQDQEDALFKMKYWWRTRPVKGMEFITDANGEADPHALSHWTSKAKRDGRTLFDAVGDVMGAQYITKKGDPNRGFYVRPDGTLLNEGDFADNSDKVAATIMSRTNFIKAMEGQKDKAEMKMLTDPQNAESWKQKRDQAEAYLNDPLAQVRDIDKQINLLTYYTGRGHGHGERIKRLERQQDRILKMHHAKLVQEGKTEEARLLAEHRKAMRGIEEKKLGVMRAKAKATTDKDMRGSLGKMADDIYNIRHAANLKYTKQDALDEAKTMKSDPRIAEMVMKIIEFADFNIDDEEKRQSVINEANKALSDIMSRSSGPKTPDDYGIKIKTPPPPKGFVMDQ